MKVGGEKREINQSQIHWLVSIKQFFCQGHSSYHPPIRRILFTDGRVIQKWSATQPSLIASEEEIVSQVRFRLLNSLSVGI